MTIEKSVIERFEQIINNMSADEFYSWLNSINKSKTNKMKSQTLPSAHQINSNVSFVVNKHKMPASIDGVKFNEGKVYYDLLLYIKIGKKLMYTLIKDVDSAFVTKGK